MRPVRASNVAATCSARVTSSPRSTATTLPAGTGNPWNRTGSRRPSSVTNDASTVAALGKGLNSTTSSRVSRAVDPQARCHVVAAKVEHGPVSVPWSPRTVCSTATVPASTSTSAAPSGAWTTSRRRSEACPPAGTVTTSVTGSGTVGAAPAVGAGGTVVVGSPSGSASSSTSGSASAGSAAGSVAAGSAAATMSPT